MNKPAMHKGPALVPSALSETLTSTRRHNDAIEQLNSIVAQLMCRIRQLEDQVHELDEAQQRLRDLEKRLRDPHVVTRMQLIEFARQHNIGP